MAPKKVTKGAVRRTIMQITAVMAVIAVFGFVWVMATYSLVSPWLITSIAVAVALPTVFLLGAAWQKLTFVSGRRLNMVCHAVVATGVMMTLIYGVNYFLRDRSTEHECRVPIEKFYSKTRHRSKRVGRRYTTQGEPYKVYYVEVRMPGGFTRDLSLTRERYEYMRRHSRDSLTLRVSKGAFGIAVASPSSIR